jgi:hypothetical protein
MAPLVKFDPRIQNLHSLPSDMNEFRAQAQGGLQGSGMLKLHGLVSHGGFFTTAINPVDDASESLD